MRLVSSLVFIVIASAIFSYFIVQTGISNHLIGSVKAVGFGPVGIIVAVCVLYIVMGAFLEGIGMLLDYRSRSLCRWSCPSVTTPSGLGCSLSS